MGFLEDFASVIGTIFNFIGTFINTIILTVESITIFISSIIQLLFNVIRLLPDELVVIALPFITTYSTIFIYKLFRKG